MNKLINGKLILKTQFIHMLTAKSWFEKVTLFHSTVVSTYVYRLL